VDPAVDDARRKAAEDLAFWQILLLQSRVSGTDVIVEAAKEKMTKGDSLVPDIKYSIMDINTRKADVENAPQKIGGAVENYKWENRDIRQCVDTRQDAAEEEYKKGMEELKKEIEEVEGKLKLDKKIYSYTLRTPQNQNTGQNKYANSNDINYLENEIVRLRRGEDNLKNDPQAKNRDSQKGKELAMIRKNLGDAQARLKQLRNINQPTLTGGKRRTTIKNITVMQKTRRRRVF
jgi:hypothetical protein